MSERHSKSGSKRKKDKKKALPLLDLSGPVEPTEAAVNGTPNTFEVHDYDYVAVRNSDEEFERDLDYLLSSMDNTKKNKDNNTNTMTTVISTSVIDNSDATKIGPFQKEGSFPLKSGNKSNSYVTNAMLEAMKESTNKTPKRKSEKFNVKDITEDLNDINFSSDSDDDAANEPVTPSKESKVAPKKVKPAVTATTVESKESEVIDFEDFVVEQVSAADAKQKEKKKLRNIKRQERRIRAREEKRQEEKENKSINSKKHEEEVTPEDLKKPFTKESTPPSDEVVKKKKKRSKKKKKQIETGNEAHEDVPDNEKELETKEEEESGDINDSSSQDQKVEVIAKKQSKVEFEDNEELAKSQDASHGPAEVFSTPIKSERKESTTSMSPIFSSSSSPEPSPFAVKLRPVNASTMNKRYSESLPEVRPIKTIIGLSHGQILKSLNLTDIKIKTIITSSSISKYATTALTFTQKHTDELFSDFERKKIFIKLCLNVALFESKGYTNTLSEHSNILELFGGYAEINLETTRTKLTPSNRNVHQNDLDYSVLAYIGNILIWALHLQRDAQITPFIDSFGIELSAKTILDNVGGYHLWDRLNRSSKTINAKRWKHINKFRQAFPFEEDQFMLVLRFLQVSDDIP
ncbi:uncharacterized protein RJT20DRAFT_65055 [Scheffersomyces xylosifermentans]|uniref:uncharacterized protein n=1 Tax=Scheffersomyces xylosifermentans TaxID=1304137 RepID=UPI00315CF64B